MTAAARIARLPRAQQRALVLPLADLARALDTTTARAVELLRRDPDFALGRVERRIYARCTPHLRIRRLGALRRLAAHLQGDA